MLASINRAQLAILAAVIGSPFATVLPAAAQDSQVVVRGLPEGTNMRLVSYRDLNLNLMAHRKILDDRVDHAVREVCEYWPGDVRDESYRMCSKAAWTGARPQITRAYVLAAQLAYGRR